MSPGISISIKRVFNLFIMSELFKVYFEIFTFSMQTFNKSLDFAPVQSLMNDTQNLTDNCKAHLSVQFASNFKLICQMWHWCCDWQWATTELHVEKKLLVSSIGCLCSHWLFRLSVLRSDNTVKIS